MATTLFLRESNAAFAVQQASLCFLPTPTSISNRPLQLSTTRGDITTVTARQGTTVTGPATVDLMHYISPPLSAGVTISGTVTFNFWMLESSKSANVGAKCTIWRYDCTTGTKSSVLASASGVELGTTAAAQNWTGAPASTAFNKGDRIIATAQFADVGTQASGFTVTLDVDHNAGGADGDSFVTFIEALTFDTGTPAGTTIYPTNTASDISTADNDLLVDFSRGAGSQTASIAVGAGPIAQTQLQVSATNARWYSPQIAATTLQGPILVNLRALESVNATGGISVKVFRRTSGGTETDIAIGLVNVNSLTSTDTAYSLTLGMSDLSLSDSDRIGVIIYADDGPAANVSASTVSATYAGTSGGAAGDTFLTFTSSFSQFTAAVQVPYLNVYPSLLAQ